MRELTLDKLPKKVQRQLDLETVFKASRCVITAERFSIFRRLDGRELSAVTVAGRTGIHKKHCEPLLDYLVFLGLLNKRGNLYRNTRLASKHFIRERSVDWSRFWSSECVQDYDALTVMETVLSSGKDWRLVLGKERKPDYQLALEDPEWAREFTYALYDIYKPDAQTLAKYLDLSGYRSLLDVGGGSGVMSMALARRHAKLRACVLDFEFVCKAARSIIRKERMSHRVKTLVGDMDKAIPSGFDVIMFWNIGHIDTRVMKMAYESLPDNGMVIRSCPPPAKPKCPSPGRFLHEYLSVRPKGQDRLSMMRGLRDAGFKRVKHFSIGQGLHMVTGYKKRAP